MGRTRRTPRDPRRGRGDRGQASGRARTSTCIAANPRPTIALAPTTARRSGASFAADEGGNLPSRTRRRTFMVSNAQRSYKPRGNLDRGASARTVRAEEVASVRFSHPWFECAVRPHAGHLASARRTSHPTGSPHPVDVLIGAIDEQGGRDPAPLICAAPRGDSIRRRVYARLIDLDPNHRRRAQLVVVVAVALAFWLL